MSTAKSMTFGLVSSEKKLPTKRIQTYILSGTNGRTFPDMKAVSLVSLRKRLIQEYGKNIDQIAVSNGHNLVGVISFLSWEGVTWMNPNGPKPKKYFVNSDGTLGRRY